MLMGVAGYARHADCCQQLLEVVQMVWSLECRGLGSLIVQYARYSEDKESLKGRSQGAVLDHGDKIRSKPSLAVLAPSTLHRTHSE